MFSRKDYEKAAYQIGAVLLWNEEIKRGDLYLAVKNGHIGIYEAGFVHNGVIESSLPLNHKSDQRGCVKVN